MAKKQMNAGVVERNDSRDQLRGKDLDHYAKLMTSMFGDTTLPAVKYKGNYIPRRVLSDFSFLTS